MQRFFREVMEEWGLPERIRVDNGNPWGRSRGLPPAMALWWMGFGIDVVWIPPNKPQRNGVVERSQGVLQQWSEPKKWKDIETGQERLEWAIKMQREKYRGEDGRTRLERFPELTANARKYCAAEEEKRWSLSEVDKRLATGQWTRKVGKNGQITLYNRAYSVGRRYARQEVWVNWDAQKRIWVVKDERGKVIREIAPKCFDAKAIRSMKVSYVKPSRRKGHNFNADEGA